MGETPKKGGKRSWTVIFVLAISASRVAMGLFWSLSGPTLLYLADNTHSTVSNISWMLSAKAAGLAIGSISCGMLLRYMMDFKPLVTVGLAGIVSGVCVLVTPWLTDLVSLTIFSMITAFMFGYQDSGLTSTILTLWGEKHSRPYLQSFHFTFGLGALIAPLIAKPFLEMADDQNSSASDQTCPGSNNLNTTEAVTKQTLLLSTMGAVTTDNPVSLDEFNPISWTYVIAGSFTILTGVLLLLTAFAKVDRKIKENFDRFIDTTPEPEQPLSEVIGLFIPVLIFYMGTLCIETLYQSYIYSVALCSGAAFSISDASLLNTMFWIGYTFGRATGIFVAAYLLPATLIVFDLCGTNISMAILSIFGENVPLVLWIGSLLIGLTVATFYSSGVSWVASKTNISSTYVFIFALSPGQVSMPLLAGYLFDLNPFNVIYLIMGFAVLNIFSGGWAYLVGRKMNKQKQALKKAQDASTKL